MDDVKPIYDDEIDLMQIVKTLWNGKWKIIGTTFIAALVGITFSLNKQNSFEVSTPIGYGKSSAFIDFISINIILKENELYLSEENSRGYKIDASSIFQMFVSEFNDYEEMISALQKDEFFKQLIKDLDEDDKRKAFIEYAKSFEILGIEKNRILSFKWHDVEEGKALFNDTLLLTLKNVKTMIINDLEKLVTSINMKNHRKLESLHVALDLIEQKQTERTKKRILYLTHHSAIAKELDIETNRFDVNAILGQSLTNDIALISISSSEFPSYLRGYKAINKEISLIKSRSKEQQLLEAVDYLEVKEKILSLENDLSSSQLRSSLKAIENDNPNDWVEFNLALADIKSQKKSMLYYVALSIVLGGMVGVFYVLISNAIRKGKEPLGAA